MNIPLSHLVPRASLVAALLAIAGCAGAVDAPGPAAPAAKPEPASTALHARVVQLIGDAACDAQGECHAVGLGAKPCGGAETWLPWSSKITDAHALQDAVQALAQARVEENKASGLASDCMRRPDPTVVCRPRASDGKKTCQLGQGGTDSAI
ncbi:MAG TPA: hypothetical protein VIP05_33860 [Burkholderiaceae bacterium]